MEKDPKNCWEWKGCSEENKANCMVYRLNMGQECWTIAHVKNEKFNPKAMEQCLSCDWYKKFDS